ncbi:MAG: VOC family protein [Gammaproteobacteria bacterium]
MSDACCRSNPPKKSDRSDDLVSSVAFGTRSRVHLAVNVRLDVFQVARFYSALFDAKPTTLVEKYAKYELDGPPLNLTINEFAENARGEAVFGLQIKSPRGLDAAKRRLSDAGYAVQDRADGVWANDPDGNGWELFQKTPGVALML